MRSCIFIALSVIVFFSEISRQTVHAQLALEPVFLNANSGIADVNFLNENIGIAVGNTLNSSNEPTGVLGYTEDGGDTWFAQANPGTSYYGAEIYDDNNVILLGSAPGGFGLILSSQDGGASWIGYQLGGPGVPGTPGLTAATFLGADHIIAGGFDSHIAFSNDRTRWSIFLVPGQGDVKSIEHFGTTVVALSVEENDTEIVNNVLIKSEDSGANWELLEADLPDGLMLNRILFGESGELYGFGSLHDRFAIALSVDQGSTWTVEYSSDDGGICRAGYIDSQNNLFAVGDEGKIIYSLRGQGWEEMTSGNRADFTSIHGAGKHVFLASELGLFRIDLSTSSINASPDARIQVSMAAGQLRFKGLITGHEYSLHVAMMDGRSRTYTIDTHTARTDISHLTRGVYVYSLIENGVSIASGSFTR